MLAGRFKLKTGNKVMGETPMLVPAFSSKFEPAIGKIIKQMPEYINGPILISAYDVYYKDITKINISFIIIIKGIRTECIIDRSF